MANPPSVEKQRLDIVAKGRKAATEIPLVRQIMEERQEEVVGEIEKALKDNAKSAWLKDELLVHCVSLRETRRLWNTLQWYVERGERIQREDAEEIQAQAEADGV